MQHIAEITAGPVEIASAQDSRVFVFRVQRGDSDKAVFVAVSGTLMASDAASLAHPLGSIVATQGRAAVEESLARGHDSKRITVSSAGVWEEPAPEAEMTFWEAIVEAGSYGK
jgi:hypothetical protein